MLARIPDGTRPLVVDNGSTDGSIAVAERFGVELVVAPQWRHGSACAVNLQGSTRGAVVMLNCNASVDPGELPGGIVPVLQGELDLVIGRRVPVTLVAYPLHLRIANRVLVKRLYRRSGVPVQGCGPVRVRRRRLLLHLCDQRSGYPPETVVRAVAPGHRTGQVLICYRARTGRSKVTGTPLGVWRAMRSSHAALR